jgi:hypothetical protein
MSSANTNWGRFLIVFSTWTLLIGAAFFFEHPNNVAVYIHGLFGTTNYCLGREEATIAPFPYDFFSNLYPAPRNATVSLVTLQSGSEPHDIFGTDSVHICQQRFFVARLIKRLQDLGAKSIVVDKFFGAHTCDGITADQNGTIELLSAVNDTKIPIALGLHTTNVTGLPAQYREIRSCLILADGLRFGSGMCKRDKRVCKKAVFA